MKEITLKKYIQFAIDNGYKHKYEYVKICKDGICYYDNFDKEMAVCFTVNLIDVITSKEFIEAIARGYSGRLDECMISQLEKDYEYITIKQAIAIRDGKLEDFISKIIP